ncbi:MAG: hypothetical protein GY805_25975 [Chloroflexi bacterium]|nr:hypothetical protein [Chloroflexota bacterium]
MSSGQTAVVTQAIAGLGGGGKTQLALEYCRRHLGDYSLIYWLTAEKEITLAESINSLGLALHLPIQQLTDPQARLAAVKQALAAKTDPWLLILDNADTIPKAMLAAALPSTGQGHILITSRNPNLDDLAEVIQLDTFPPEEAAQFLLIRSGKINKAAAIALAETLGFFPLALDWSTPQPTCTKRVAPCGNTHNFSRQSGSHFWPRQNAHHLPRHHLAACL